MHAYLAFLAGVLVVVAGLLIFWASVGVTVIGLALEAEAITAVILLIIAAITIWLFYVGIKAQYKKVKTGKEALIGAKGIAVSDLNPKGEIRVLGEFWQATAKDGAIVNGEAVLVVDMDGMFLVVVPDQQNT
jgi:membrane-bound ClpP family serine protease